MTGAASGDGPWRVAARIEIVAAGGEPVRTALAGTLRAAGLEIVADDPAADLLVVDAATRLSGEALIELRRVADHDPMIVAAMPRFLRPAEPDVPDGARPPALDYAVLPDPRCLYVKRSVLLGLSETLPADAVGGRIAGLNRFGFRVAVAGHAVAHHPDGAARPRPEHAPPDLRVALRRHLSSAPAAADRLIAGLAPDADGRPAIAFDLSALTAAHSGTTRLATALVTRAARSWHDLAVHVVATEAACAAHLPGLGSAVTRVDPAEPRAFAAAIRIGQPFLWSEVDAFAARAPVLVVLLLDTIGFDCLAHAPDELDALWRFVCAEADGLLFNSAFTDAQFGRRFAIRPGMPCAVSLHSLTLADYGGGTRGGDPGEGVLIVGNAFPHKRVRETAEALAAAKLGLPVTALGLADGAVSGVAGLPSGGLSPQRLEALYAAARVVVYPSVYEGFGFPVLEALAHRRPVLARDLPPFREIAARLPAAAANLHAFSDDRDLVARLRDPPAWSDASASGPVRGWDDAASDLRAVLDRATLGVDRARVIRRIDLLRGRLGYMRDLHRATGDETLDRLAGAAGRLAQGGAATLGRLLPAPVLGLAARALRRGR